MISRGYPYNVYLLQYDTWHLAFADENWMFWLSLYYMKMFYALSSFPFLLFGVPVLGSILTHARPTGYDKMGILCPKLGASKVAKKLKQDRELQHTKLIAEHRCGLQKTVASAAESVAEGVATVPKKLVEIPMGAVSGVTRKFKEMC